MSLLLTITKSVLYEYLMNTKKKCYRCTAPGALRLSAHLLMLMWYLRLV